MTPRTDATLHAIATVCVAVTRYVISMCTPVRSPAHLHWPAYVSGPQTLAGRVMCTGWLMLCGAILVHVFRICL